MDTFRYNAARVKLNRIGGSGVVEAAYTGPLTTKSFDTLRTDALASAANSHGFVIRVDTGLITFDPDAPPVWAHSYSANMAPGAIITRPDQYLSWVGYAAEAAKHGVMRSVWVASHAHLAYEWTLRASSARLKELQP
jgi:hypothetical protein